MESFVKEFEHLKIPLEEIIRVTNNFCNKPIGSGGFGKVYRGELSHSKGRGVVVIKRVDRKFGQGDPEFWREIMMLSRYSHKNLISLLGFCDEAGEKIILYELAPNGSLDRYLSSLDLTWEQRIKICLGAARGLSYLHDNKGTQQRVIHRDVKSSNILLDDQWNAKVSDMGLSKLGPANQEHTAIFTNVVGTLGYLDPLYLKTGVLTKESDVYSFGVVLFEVLCGRLCFNSNGYLVPTWKQSYINKKLHEILFQDLTQPMVMSSLKIFSDIAFQCVQESHEKRPTMSRVVEKLEIALLFEQHHDLKLPMEYVSILMAVATPPKYNSLEELRLLLSIGVLLDAGKTWFSINDKGEHSVLISINECLIREAGNHYSYSTQFNSRFPIGTYSVDWCRFKTQVRTQFLSPNVSYAVNLVYKKKSTSDNNFMHAINLKYKLDGETNSCTSHLAVQREDGWFSTELYQMTSDGTPVNLNIIFEDSIAGLVVEGVEFQPMENVEERQVSEDDDKQVDMQLCLSYSDDDAYWEQKLPNDYQEIIKLSKDRVKWKTKKELYSTFCQGFLIEYSSSFKRLFNNGQWFFLDKNGKKCLMISAREAFQVNNITKTSWLHSNDSRVLPEYRSKFKIPLVVRDTYVGSWEWTCCKRWYIYLVRPQTPVIRPKVDENTHNPLIRPKIKGLPQQRSDLWMEVKVYEFQTVLTKGVIPSLELQPCVYDGSLDGLIIQGVEFRPLKVYHPVNPCCDICFLQRVYCNGSWHLLSLFTLFHLNCTAILSLEQTFYGQISFPSDSHVGVIDTRFEM